MTWDLILQVIVPPLAVALIISYFRLIFRSLASDVESVSKDVRKSTDRIEASLERINNRVDGHGTRLHSIELSQARREGSDAALQLVVQGHG